MARIHQLGESQWKKLVPLLTTPRGEVGQRDFWLCAAVLFAASVVTNLIPHVGTAVALMLLYPWTGLALKRLRDMTLTADTPRASPTVTEVQVGGQRIGDRAG